MKNELLALEHVAEEIKAILVEAEFTARWGLIEAHHSVGTLILGLGGDKAKLVQSIAEKIDRSERTLWYDVKFAERYPKVNALPEGKNISWSRVIKKYLTTPQEAREHEHSWITICSVCRERKEND